ncbi:rod shape-determining protein [Candidatus Parcubacteria bacterium]|nr:MAG: rod shape-determining protein [Candidatus Parcubacteria bacterium]
MLNNFFGIFSKDLGIDLGTANTLVYIKNKGISITEPSVVAINQKTNQVLEIGEGAKKMIGRTPSHISVTRPLINGVISDFEVTEQMLRYFIGKAHQDFKILVPRPKVIVGIPSIATEVEKKAVQDAAFNAGAREVYLIEELVASALGSRLPIDEPVGTLVADIGGGTTEVGIISMGGLVTIRSLKVAGDRFNEDIINYARDQFKQHIGERAAEEVKIAIGSAVNINDDLEMSLKGRDVVSGLPKEVTITSSQVKQALSKSLKTIIEAIHNTIEDTPPELVADILHRGMVLSGGSSLLRGLDRLIAHEIKIPVKIADDPLTSVVRGTGLVLENFDYYRKFLNFVE